MARSTVGLTGRRRRGALGALVALVGGVVLVAMPGAASGGEPEKGADRAICAESYRSAQVQRRSGALRRARESLLLCVSDRCPALIQPDCLRWLTEVEAAMPSVTFAAKGVDGKDVTDVRVVLDGQVLRESLDGKSIAVDPGTHTLHFEHGTEPPIDQQLVVREGEKARIVTVSWLAAPPRESGEDRAARSVSSGPPTAAWIFGGVGAASLATFGILAFHGMQRRSDLEKECFGSCTRGQIDSVKSELTAADIALGVGIVSVGVATVLFLTNGSSEKAAAPSSSSVSVGVAPHKTGAAVGVSGRF